MNSMAFRALQRFPRLEQVLAAFDAFPPLVLPISVTRLELLCARRFGCRPRRDSPAVSCSRQLLFLSGLPGMLCCSGDLRPQLRGWPTK
jgi:hypothetical protein